MKKTEGRIQSECVKWFRKEHQDGLIFHVPNGGSRRKGESAKFKSEGVLAGIPDLCVMFKDLIFFIEMKTPEVHEKKNCGLSKAQKNIHERFKELGFEVFVCSDLTQFQEIIYEQKTKCND